MVVASASAEVAPEIRKLFNRWTPGSFSVPAIHIAG
jgi:hypothetical protein